MGAATQIRVLGGTIGLAICSALLSNHVTSQTAGLLTPARQAALLQSSENIRYLPPELQVSIRQVYAAGYDHQMRVMLYFCVASMVSLLLLVEWPPRRLRTSEDGEIVGPEQGRRVEGGWSETSLLRH
jgi:hypothetical protein